MIVVRGFFARERSVLLLMLFASLVAHTAAFLMLAVVDRPDGGGWNDRPRVHVMQPTLELTDGRTLLYRLADRLDPSLISAPSLHGFSRKMFAKSVPLLFQVQNWQIGPSYLEPDPAPGVTNLLVHPELTDTLQSAVPLVVATAGQPLEDVTPATPIVDRSVFQLRGGLEKREVVRSPSLPAIPHLGGLRPTAIRVGVGRDGLVKYSMLERASGDEKADAAALTAVRQLQLAPGAIDGEELQWGTVRFFWGYPTMIPIDLSTALLLYLFMYLGLVMLSWWRYEWGKSRKQSISGVTEDQQHGHVDRARS